VRNSRVREGRKIKESASISGHLYHPPVGKKNQGKEKKSWPLEALTAKAKRQKSTRGFLGSSTQQKEASGGRRQKNVAVIIPRAWAESP